MKRSRSKKLYLRLQLFSLLFLTYVFASQPLQAQYRPELDLEELFEDVQLRAVFPDSKTFADCVPLQAPEQILRAYREQRQQPGFSLEAFVRQHFQIPTQASSDYVTDTSRSVTEHIEQLWQVLTRQPDEGGGFPCPTLM